MQRYWPLLVALACWCSACDRRELPVPAHVAGDVQTHAVDLGADYRWQAFFDLGTGQMVASNLKTDWDLGFETTADGYHIVLNTSKAMYAFPTAATDMADVNDTLGLGMGKRWDAPSGNLDSTAIGDWRGGQQVYVIDRGYNAMGQHQGYRKLQVLAMNAEAYELRFSELNGSGEKLFTVAKDSSYNLSFLSFEAGGKMVTIEPPKQNWDLCFSQYLEVLPEPYLVTGVLLNRYHTSAVMDSSLSFATIDYSFATGLQRSSAMNAVGYAWKYYHFNSATYHVLPQMNYLIADAQGILYKLHFIDFYNDQGGKGSPRWENQQL